MKYREMLEVVY